jgi:uncharacterized protein (TIGR00251 family)
MTILFVRATPNAMKPQVTVMGENKLSVKVDAPAQDNEANQRLIEILSDHFDVPRSAVFIVKGQKSKNKIIEIGER